MRYRCNACGEVYRDTQPDGSRFYHICELIPDALDAGPHEREGHRDERPELGAHPITGPRRAEGAGRTVLPDEEPAAEAGEPIAEQAGAPEPAAAEPKQEA